MIRKLVIGRLSYLLKTPSFYVITIVGNGLVIGAASLLYFFEGKTNVNVNSFLDAVWWAVATVTTVGYGDISPVTEEGKILGICLMLLGTALFAAYTALFAGVLLAQDYRMFSKEMRSIRKIKGDIQEEERSLDELKVQLDELLHKINRKVNSR